MPSFRAPTRHGSARACDPILCVHQLELDGVVMPRAPTRARRLHRLCFAPLHGVDGVLVECRSGRARAEDFSAEWPFHGFHDGVVMVDITDTGSGFVNAVQRLVGGIVRHGSG
jgi:hypothetical protein